MKSIALLAAAPVALLAGCAAATQIGALDPHPNLSGLSKTVSYQLVVAPTVADAFELRGKGLEVHVAEWHTTLTRSFENAVGHRQQAAAENRIVRIERAELELRGANEVGGGRDRGGERLAFAGNGALPVIFAHGGHVHVQSAAPPPVPLRARITYRVSLLDGRGEPLASSSGAVVSAALTSRKVSLADVVTGAVEALIETAFAELLRR